MGLLIELATEAGNVLSIVRGIVC